MEIPQQIITAIYRRTFRISVEVRTPACPPKYWAGTAFCFASWRQSNRSILATAKHVLDFQVGSDVTIRFERFNREDELETSVTLKCQSDAIERPFGFYKLSDIGYVHLPCLDDSGNPLFDQDEGPLPSLPVDGFIAAGSWVAWAGFPAQVERSVGRPQLCFFQGTVSAFGKRGDQGGHAYYIVDGHAAPGVSGGPMWEFTPDGSVVVAGIVSSFQSDETIIPGFCCFEPINPLVCFAQTKFIGQ